MTFQGWKSGSPDTILEGGHPRIIPQKFGCNWPSGFSGEDFYVSFGHLKKFLFLVMAAILDTGRRWQTQFWKGTTQGSFQQSLVEIGSVLSEEKIFFFNFNPTFFYFQLGGHLSWKSGSPDTILEGGHPRIIPQKFGCNWPSGFWGEDFYVNFP